MIAFSEDDTALRTIGLGLALALVVLVRLLLPREQAKATRLAATYLVLAGVFGLVDWLTPLASQLKRTVDFFFWLFLLASLGRSLVLFGIDVVFGRKTHRAPPRIFRDLTQAIVYVIVLLLTLRAVGVEPGSLLTTSALLTAVLGLALQDTLGNLVSGLTLQMKRPFEVGDWIQFDPDGRQVGQVTEVNWRATTVRTSELVEVSIPNGILAKTAIRNFSRPSHVSRRMVTVQAPYDVSPSRVHETIAAALVGTPGVLSDPAPWVQTRLFADSGIEYGVCFFTDDYAARERIDGNVRDRVWYALKRAKLSVPFPTRTVHLREASKEERDREHALELERRNARLRAVDFLGVLPDAAHRALAASVDVRLFAPSEVVVRQGDSASEMFIIDRGEVAIELVRDGETLSVAKLGPGNFFGEMGLLTGEIRTATARALTECTLLVVGHDAFHATIGAEPCIVEKISELLAARQAELESAASKEPAAVEPSSERSRRLLSQIRSFFKL